MARRRKRIRGIVARPATDNELFNNITENALQFIDRGVKELWSDRARTHLKFSVISFYSGIELIIKARLLLEHWSLIFSDVNKASLKKMKTGDFQSVGLDEAITRLSAIANDEIDQRAIECFRQLRLHRNQMVHFYHRASEDSKEGASLKKNIVREQCRAWHHIKYMLDGRWAGHFASVGDAIKNIDKKMRRHRDFLGAIFETISGDLKLKAAAGAVLAKCHSCGFETHAIQERGPIESECGVCGYRQTFVTHKCDKCGGVFFIEEGFDECKCVNCGEVIELHCVMNDYCEEGEQTPEDFYIDGGYAHCGECSGYETVGTVNGRPFCFMCFSWANSGGTCGWCHSRSTGDLEDSFLRGCAMCDGRLGHEKDD